MAPRPLDERVRGRLLALLADDRPEPAMILARLKELRDFDAMPAFAAAVSLLVHLDLRDPEAETLLGDILVHRVDMQRALQRDPGLRVAAVDFLSHVHHRLANPKIAELSLFEQTERSAATDPLTGVPDRRFFAAAMEREVRRSRRHRLRFSLLLFDLDRFKSINVAHGHLFGDVVLQRVAREIRASIREADLGCRFGGEVFAVILPETDRRGAIVVGERVRVRVEDSFAEHPVRRQSVLVTLSGGASCYPEDGHTPDALVARAGEALHIAKETGRNRIFFHHSERRESVRYPAQPLVHARLATGPESAGQPARALDLSRSGVLLETQGSFRPITAVRIRFDGDGTRDAGWEVEGRVARVERVPGGAGLCRAGIAFGAPVPEERLWSHVRKKTDRLARPGS